MSLRIVADEAKLTKAHVWELEKGLSRNPCVSTLFGLAEALEVTPFILAAAAFEDLPGVYTIKRSAAPKRMKQ
jgi:transcriptional regulator with XRE-family HTH domain